MFKAIEIVFVKGRLHTQHLLITNTFHFLTGALNQLDKKNYTTYKSGRQRKSLTEVDYFEEGEEKCGGG